nr:hypothetical protein [Tanacetum cinerariifolium]
MAGQACSACSHDRHIRDYTNLFLIMMGESDLYLGGVLRVHVCSYGGSLPFYPVPRFILGKFGMFSGTAMVGSSKKQSLYSRVYPRRRGRICLHFTSHIPCSGGIGDVVVVVVVVVVW